MSNVPSKVLPNLAFSLNGGTVGDVRVLQGLTMQADIAANDLGPDNVAKKHVSNISWSPGSATMGLGMGPAMAAWLHASFANKAPIATGSITMAGTDNRAQSTLSFTDALLTRVGFPALDIASSDPAALIVEFTPEQVRLAKGDGSDIRAQVPAPKSWLCSGFRIEIGALPCQRVRRVEAFTWTCAVTADQVGIFREPTKHPAKVTVPDLILTIDAADRQAWSDAATSWFVAGNHLEGNELPGTLTLLAPDKTAIARIGLSNVGFKAFETLSTLGATPDRFVVTLYIEAMSFDLLA
jgi:hypothetical protein